MIVKVTTDTEIKETALLAREIWTEHYTPLIGQTQVEYMLDKFQSEAAIKDQIEEKQYLYFLIRKGKDNIGYLAVKAKEKELFLSKFYIKKQERGKGFGRKAMLFAEDLAKKKHLKKIYLTVNKHNSGSIKAYHKLGFRTESSLIQAIGQGFVMDDFKLVKTLHDRSQK